MFGNTAPKYSWKHPGHVIVVNCGFGALHHKFARWPRLPAASKQVRRLQVITSWLILVATEWMFLMLLFITSGNTPGFNRDSPFHTDQQLFNLTHSEVVQVG